jgi:hypothetical protein
LFGAWAVARFQAAKSVAMLSIATYGGNTMLPATCINDHSKNTTFRIPSTRIGQMTKNKIIAERKSHENKMESGIHIDSISILETKSCLMLDNS